MDNDDSKASPNKNSEEYWEQLRRRQREEHDRRIEAYAKQRRDKVERYARRKTEEYREYLDSVRTSTDRSRQDSVDTGSFTDISSVEEDEPESDYYEPQELESPDLSDTEYDLSEIESQLDDTTHRVDLLEIDHGSLEADLAFVRDDVDGLRAELRQVLERLGDLDGEVQRLTDDRDHLQSSVESLRSEQSDEYRDDHWDQDDEDNNPDGRRSRSRFGMAEAIAVGVLVGPLVTIGVMGAYAGITSKQPPTDFMLLLYFGAPVVAAFIGWLIYRTPIRWRLRALRVRRSVKAETYPANWDQLRRSVYWRDGYRCSNCGAANVELHAHHVVPLSREGTNRISNLITLCAHCHTLIHPHMRSS